MANFRYQFRSPGTTRTAFAEISRVGDMRKRFPMADRRGARRLSGPLRVELWSRGRSLLPEGRLDVKDYSNRGFYFFSSVRPSLGATFDFSLFFRKPGAREEIDLVRGVAEVVRCEDLGPARAGFGIAAKIEE